MIALIFTVFLDMIGIGIIIPILAPIIFDFSGGILPASVDASSRALILGIIV